jgi:hypothetical protein
MVSQFSQFRSSALVERRVGDEGFLAGGGAAELAQLALPGSLSGASALRAALTSADACFFAGFGTLRSGSSGAAA